MQFFYVYIRQSESDPDHFYTGITEDLRARLAKHNAGEVPHTAKFRPWRIKTAIAFAANQRAIDFERYLKTASGRACAEKRLRTHARTDHFSRKTSAVVAWVPRSRD